MVTDYEDEFCSVCGQCKQYLVDGDDASENIWPSFLAYFLTKGQKRAFERETTAFHSIYEGTILWKVIPWLMRPWWIESLRNFGAPNFPYSNITIELPAPVFIDKTIDVEIYDDDFNSGTFSRVINAMNNVEVMNKNILCPWSCSYIYTQSGRFPLDLMLMKIFPKMLIDGYSDKKQFRLIQSSWTQYFRESVDEYATILMNDKWKIQPSIIVDESGIHVLTCQYNNS